MDRRDRIAAFGSGQWPQGTTFNRAAMTARVPAEDLDLPGEAPSEDGSDAVIVRCVAQVCCTCNGRGRHVNPAIDAEGLSAEDFDDEDFAEDYVGGTYDVPCYECGGDTTVLVAADDNGNDPAVLAALSAWSDGEACSQRERAAEMRYGF